MDQSVGVCFQASFQSPIKHDDGVRIPKYVESYEDGRLKGFMYHARIIESFRKSYTPSVRLNYEFILDTLSMGTESLQIRSLTLCRAGIKSKR